MENIYQFCLASYIYSPSHLLWTAGDWRHRHNIWGKIRHRRNDRESRLWGWGPIVIFPAIISQRAVWWYTYWHHNGTHTLSWGPPGGPKVKPILEVGNRRLRHENARIDVIGVTLNQAGSTLRLLNDLFQYRLLLLQVGKRDDCNYNVLLTL